MLSRIMGIGADAAEIASVIKLSGRRWRDRYVMNECNRKKYKRHHDAPMSHRRTVAAVYGRRKENSKSRRSQTAVTAGAGGAVRAFFSQLAVASRKCLIRSCTLFTFSYWREIISRTGLVRSSSSSASLYS